MAAPGLTVSITGTKAVRQGLRQMNPEENRKITVPALLESMFLTLRIAARDKIYPGGPPDVVRDGILTSRTGTLRRSLTGSFSIDRRGLPNFLEGGSNLIYAPVHEFGSRTHPMRPFLKPALKDAEKKFEAIFVKHWKRAGGPAVS